MKKTIAYVATAIILGFAVMILPLASNMGSPTYSPQPKPGYALAGTNNNEASAEERDILQLWGLGSQRSNLLPSSLIFLSGFVVALGVYTILKRRTT